MKKQPGKKIILLAGPTGVGKTALSIMLAKLLNGEIISTDSIQVYRGMDIGSAKVSKKERDSVPHHLIDIRHVQEPFNVVDFYYEARQVCDSILARNKVPILVGGAGFYFKTFVSGPPPGPPSVKEIRAQIEAQMAEQGVLSMYEKLHEYDPEYAGTISSKDIHKIVRAFEIITLTGAPVSACKWAMSKARPDKSTAEEYVYMGWFLSLPRDILHQRINERCDAMLAEGFVEEVKALKQEGIQKNPSAARSIGYAQCLKFLESNQSMEEYNAFVADFKTASRRYVRRQCTWFKKDPLFDVLDINGKNLQILAEELADNFANNH
ncbi:tRNA (adenosine(37)-N6)-dimethylallyltransferase MiaA [Candidatus Clavichlamydia salmonicola]|uniref:tRNA (adenosine(37)-N6)-dimethylallyltransferase MiaA n=1 Tax=Candidatus Clavichlamydia salmonicola TaxID=469812 RepID=UPI0018910CF0|nr:tRNA (adenosine(37)-N6)-dimethylallyltransferase MiaA [Candidatus Clavichlamydia salmonicola]